MQLACVGFVVLTALVMNAATFWDVAPRSVYVNRGFIFRVENQLLLHAFTHNLMDTLHLNMHCICVSYSTTETFLNNVGSLQIVEIFCTNDMFNYFLTAVVISS
jgi:hypothetical protein